ncbi:MULTISPECIES: hypothetical protein [Nosocomiicoccus]|uniref:hypothetical protein n=1 Tax=Nosocomiicoccus TaxID=489909 RepID=UPI00143C9C1D|nr:MULTISPECIES: hypothetical protein [Nosocomiicoccus]MDK6862986.1 hypothetical protein [Nosocomiicoccus ampullae]
MSIKLSFYHTLEGALDHLLVDDEFKLTETDNNMMTQTINEFYIGDLKELMIYNYY